MKKLLKKFKKPLDKRNENEYNNNVALESAAKKIRSLKIEQQRERKH